MLIQAKTQPCKDELAVQARDVALCKQIPLASNVQGLVSNSHLPQVISIWRYKPDMRPDEAEMD